jgi:hypothetical protein
VPCAWETEKPRDCSPSPTSARYVNNAIKGKLLESATLVQQAANNTKEQFANSPDLAREILNAIMDAFAAHSSMSKQALESEKIRSGLKEVLLGPVRLYESLRERSDSSAMCQEHRYFVPKGCK